MGNRATLLFTSRPNYTDDDVGTGVLAWDWAIAALWFALFQKVDLKHFEYLERFEEDEGEGEEPGIYQVPYLVTSAELARKNLEQRKPALLERLSPAGRAGLGRLEAKLGEASGFVILDMWEVWNMSGDDFETFVITSIARMDQGDLKPVLEHSHMRQSSDEHPEPYCGYEWNAVKRGDDA